MVYYIQNLITTVGGATPQPICQGNSYRVCVILTGNLNRFIEVYASPAGSVANQFVDTQSVSHLILPYRDYGSLIQTTLSAGWDVGGQVWNVTEVIDDRFSSDFGFTWR